jgi:hypothetical protein
MNEIDKKYPEGHFVGKWMGIGIAICSGLWIPLCIIIKTPGLIGVGPAIGFSIGLVIGSLIESKYKKEGKIRPSTKQEKNKRKIAIIAGIAILVLGFAMFILLFLKNNFII